MSCYFAVLVLRSLPLLITSSLLTGKVAAAAAAVGVGGVVPGAAALVLRGHGTHGERASAAAEERGAEGGVRARCTSGGENVAGKRGTGGGRESRAKGEGDGRGVGRRAGGGAGGDAHTSTDLGARQRQQRGCDGRFHRAPGLVPGRADPTLNACSPLDKVWVRKGGEC